LLAAAAAADSMQAVAVVAAVSFLEIHLRQLPEANS
jgi:hypothetical protein